MSDTPEQDRANHLQTEQPADKEMVEAVARAIDAAWLDELQRRPTMEMPPFYMAEIAAKTALIRRSPAAAQATEDARLLGVGFVMFTPEGEQRLDPQRVYVADGDPAWPIKTPADDTVTVAAKELIADVRRRYPGEELRCQFMRALDEALKSPAPGSKG